MLRKCYLHQSIFFFIILGAACFISTVDVSSQKRSVVPRSSCSIPFSNNHYYLMTSCEGGTNRCRLKTNDIILGNGTVVAIKCKQGMSLVSQDFSVCFDGKWYPRDHSCIRLSSTCGLDSPIFTNEKLKFKDGTLLAPWHTEILELNEMDNSNKTLCGGTLITPQIVLTAFSCVTEGNKKRKKEAKKLLVGLGRTKLNENQFNQVLRVQEVSEGPRFAVLPAVEFRKLEEIAILKVVSAVEISYEVMPACFDSTILNPQTGYSFLSGKVVGLTKTVKKDPPTNTDEFSQNVNQQGVIEKMEMSGTKLADQKMELIQVYVYPTDYNTMDEDDVSVFKTNLLNFKHFGSGFIVEVSGRYYILGVHIGNNEDGSSFFNKVYFGSIGETITQYIKENK